MHITGNQSWRIFIQNQHQRWQIVITKNADILVIFKIVMDVSDVAYMSLVYLGAAAWRYMRPWKRSSPGIQRVILKIDLEKNLRLRDQQMYNASCCRKLFL